ncbi:MAG: DUF805 domain-containing protein [Ruminococcaceae bacterium]|nr:DUF805 domain-containing protein [Oscillospiraceae bacterium]
MNEYIAMWKNYANFSDRTSVRGYWMAFLFNILASFVIGFISGLVPALSFLTAVYSLAVLIPGLAITVRRLRDAGYKWTTYFWLLLPLVGAIIFLVRLCKKSAILEVAE